MEIVGPVRLPLVVLSPEVKACFSDTAVTYRCEKTILLTNLLGYYFCSEHRGLQEYFVTSFVEAAAALNLTDGCM